jgi:hypothetical protein
MATLLPNAKQQFFNGNGQPLAGGSVYMYIPNTTTLKNTWKDAGQTQLNTNPIVLDANGEAVIYGAGAYRQQVYDSAGNLQWDAQTQDLTSVLQGQVVLWCGLAGGSGDSITLTPTPAITALVAGQNFEFIASAANSGNNPVDINISGLGFQTANFRGSSSVPANLLHSGVTTLITWNGTNFDIMSPPPAIFNDSITTSPSISVSPTGNAAITTLTSFNVQTNAASATTREFMVCLGFTSATGSANAGPPNYADKVALYAGMTGNTGTSNIWAINTVTTVATAAAGLYNADGYEIDVNNNSGSDYADLVTGPAVSCYGAIASMGGTNKTTSGFAAVSFAGGCWYGFAVAGTNFLNAAFLDTSTGIVNGMKIYGSKSGALIDLSQASSGVSQGLLVGQGTGVYGVNAGGTAQYNLIEASGASVIIGDSTHWTNVQLNATTAVYTGSDNVVSLGTSLQRWSVVYAATGTINTSDENVKFDIAPLPQNMLELVKNTDPIAYKHKDGGMEPIEVTQEEDVPVFEEIQTTRRETKIVDGRAIQVEVPDVIKHQVYDEFPVFDAAGNPIYDITPAKEEVKNEKGEVIVEATPEIRTQRLHRVPRTEKKLVTKTIMQSRVGKRTHFGFSAQKIKEVTSRLQDSAGNQLDFAGFTQDPTSGLCGLRMDQLIPILWQAVQELSAQVEELKQGK